MNNIIKIPHRVCASTCYINGLEDIFEWKGKRYLDYFLSVLGGMGEFTYLKFKNAHPPQMVFCGASPKYLLNDLEKIIGFKQEVTENRTFKYTLSKIKHYIDDGNPVVVGAVDMYYLNYFKDIYKTQHIPIHYILIVGYDDERQEVLILDCTFSGVKNISYNELEKAMNVEVKGISKKNTIRVFFLPEEIPDEFELANKGFKYRVEKMLNPPVDIFGIPAMKKLSKEIFNWEDESSFDHLIIYATIPPHLPRSFNNSNGMRAWKSFVLREFGEKYKIAEWIEASRLFDTSGKLFTEICKAACKRDRKQISNLLVEAANIEERAYILLRSL